MLQHTGRGHMPRPALPLLFFSKPNISKQAFQLHNLGHTLRFLILAFFARPRHGVVQTEKSVKIMATKPFITPKIFYCYRTK
jgi:hypothetical protein